ncbi:MAG: DUF87 domain-containing protein [Candidatus Bipolaricaulota bacterium]|nr:DUF87 domain-containing protein [Candidatus Bipolaricaulota bacterium]
MPGEGALPTVGSPAMSVLTLGPDLVVPVDHVVGQCVAVLGIRGSGKSNTAGVLFEELLAAHYPLSIVDIDGEYFGLKERHEVLVLGGGDHADVELTPVTAAEVAELSLREGVPVVLDVSDLVGAEREALLLDYLSRLWALAGRLRTPYMIGIEECHEFIPQGVRTRMKEVVVRIALRGRKRGLGTVIISQRSAKVEKDVLTQAGMLFLHRVVHEADMRVYGELLPWGKAEVKEVVTGLRVGECVYIAGAEARRVAIRLRNTFHGGYTPAFHPVESPKLRLVRGRLLEALARNPLPPAQDEVPAVGDLALSEARTRETMEGEEAVSELPEPVALRVERLLRRLERLPPLERRVVAFLAAREPRAYTVHELAAWIDCPEALLRAEPPHAALELGLIACERLSRGPTYRGTVRPYVEEAFAPFAGALGPSGLHGLAHHLRRRLADLAPAARDLTYTS